MWRTRRFQGFLHSGPYRILGLPVHGSSPRSLVWRLWSLYCKDILFLGGDERVDILHLLVGYFLDIVLSLLLGILGEFSGLLGLLEEVNTVAASVSYDHLGILAGRLRLLDEFLTSLLGEGRHHATDGLAVV